MGNKEPVVVAVPAQLVDQMVGTDTGAVHDVHHPDTLQGLQNGMAGEVQLLGGSPQFFSAGGRDGIRIFGGISQEDQLTTLLCEGFQPLQSGGAQGLAAGDKDGIVGHFSHPEGIGTGFALLRQQGFAHKVKIDAAV